VFAGLVLLALSPVVVRQAVAGEDVHLHCAPRTFQVVPGEPMQLKLTVRADSAAPIHLHVPRHPSLKLRAIEKFPVRRTRDGTIVQKRLLVWQALEPGKITLKTLSVETEGKKLVVPEITITVRNPGP
jgi:hypothetical protein